MKDKEIQHLAYTLYDQLLWVREELLLISKDLNDPALREDVSNQLKLI